MIYRIFVEKKDNLQAKKIRDDLAAQLGIHAEDVREVIRYDVEGISEEEFEQAVAGVFSEPPRRYGLPRRAARCGGVFRLCHCISGRQYDQRADSAAQCVQLLTQKGAPARQVRARHLCKGRFAEELARIKHHLINPVESNEVSLEKPRTLKRARMSTHDVPVVYGFTKMSDEEIAAYHKQNGFAMSVADLAFVRDYSKKRGATRPRRRSRSSIPIGPTTAATRLLQPNFARDHRFGRSARAEGVRFV